jgi:hypothetical protein
MDMVVRWPEGGVVTVDWVMGLGNVLDYASRNLQPSQLPDVIPVSVADSLILAASKVCILAYLVGGGWGGGFFLGVSLSLSPSPFECRPFAWRRKVLELDYFRDYFCCCCGLPLHPFVVVALLLLLLLLLFYLLGCTGLLLKFCCNMELLEL